MSDQNQISVQVGGDVKGELIVAGGNVTVDRRTIYAGQPPSAAERADARNRLVLLEKVNAFWVQSVLEKSLHGMARIDLGMEERADSVEHPWEMMLQTLDGQPQSITPGTSTIDLFDRMTQAMLILGDPGSGKTTMLLDLTRSLIARTRDNVDSPIPVVFTLSAWADKRLPLVDWLVDELNAKYLVPKETGREWLKQQSLGLMLDGLDEIQLDLRDDCVTAINSFRAEYGLTPICVTSRTAEYEMLAAPLKVEGAVVMADQTPTTSKDGKGLQLKLEGALLLKPLTGEQIDGYISRAGPELAGLRTMMEQDAALRELAQSPLMLSIMMVAYRGLTAEQLSHGNLEDHRKHLFDAYIQRMFTRKAGQARYTREQITKYLSWLAGKMQQSGQTMLMIERIQPTWLDTQEQRRAYNMLQRIAGFPAMALPFVLTGTVLAMLTTVVLLAEYVMQYGVNPVEIATNYLFSMLSAYSIILSVSAGIGLVVALIVSVVLGRNADRGIEVVETLRWSPGWSWPPALGGLVGVLLGGAVIGLIEWITGMQQETVRTLPAADAVFRLGASLVMPLIFGLAGGVLWAGVFGVLFGGMKSGQVESFTRPNEGIRQSLRNSFLLGLGVQFGVTLIAVLLVSALLWLRITLGAETFQVLGLFGLAVAAVAAIAGYSITMRYGGAAVAQHMVLRGILHRSQRLPFRLVPMLDEAAERILLRKVGGGYIFVHRLLLEHFAAMTPEPAPPLTPVPAAASANIPPAVARVLRPALAVAAGVLTIVLLLNSQPIWAIVALLLTFLLAGMFEHLTDRRVLIGAAALITGITVFMIVWAVFFNGKHWLRGRTLGDSIRAVHWSNDGSTMILTDALQAHIYNAESGKVLRRTQVVNPDFTVYIDQEISPNGTRMLWSGAAEDGGTSFVRDLQSGEVLFAWKARYLGYARWSPDSQQIAGVIVPDDPDEVVPIGVNVVDAQSGEIVRTYETNGFVGAMSWSPDGTQIAAMVTSADEVSHLTLIDVASGEMTQIGDAELFISRFDEPLWSPDGRRIAMPSASNDYIYILDAATGEHLGGFSTNSAFKQYRSVAWSPDSKLIATGTTWGELYFYDASSSELVGSLLGHARTIPWLAWSPDGKRIVTGDEGARFILWNVEQELADAR